MKTSYLIALVIALAPLVLVRLAQQPGQYSSPGVRGNAPGVSTHPVSPYPAATATTARPTVIVVPSPVPTLAPTLHAPSAPAAASGLGWIPGSVTHYGESFQGLPLACGGTYDTSNVEIAAVAFPSRNAEWPCGTRLEVEGPEGTITVTRLDSCPGCGHNQLDLSEAGIRTVCGDLGRCEVKIRRVE